MQPTSPNNNERIVEYIQKNNFPFLFITGKAGSGKSTLLKNFCQTTQKRFAIVAPTGIAALNVGGQTIHSFFRFPVGIFDRRNIKKQNNAKLWQNLDLIIIDEVSMVEAKIIDDIDYFMRLNGRNPDLPFGGVQIIAFGDLFQLPPVYTQEKEEIQNLGYNYETPYFFSADIFQSVPIKTIELTTTFRQSDSEFLELLNQIRIGKINAQSLEKLNQRCNFLPKSNSVITLTTTNEKARNINLRNLESLKGKAHTFIAEIQGEIPESAYPADYKLILKPEAQIIFLKNDNTEGRWANGTLGKVQDLGNDWIRVKIPDSNSSGKQKIYEVERVEWEKVRYEFDEKKGEIIPKKIGSFTQFPLRLAWAITIHKSQGKTFDEVLIDKGRRAFAPGQIYVALSRCTSLEGVYLTQPITRQDIFTDSVVVDFMSRLDIINI
jgi:energy-coupling factor transporter ATP-binding protein EcfA2